MHTLFFTYLFPNHEMISTKKMVLHWPGTLFFMAQQSSPTLINPILSTGFRQTRVTGNMIGSTFLFYATTNLDRFDT